jgi:hypothetical protein
VFCKEDFGEKDFDFGWVVGIGFERRSGAENNRGRRDLPLSDLFQVV